MFRQLAVYFCMGLALFGTTASAAPEIRVLSNRADLISGDDALVEVVLPEKTRRNGVQVILNDRNISDQFAVRENGRFMGLVEGLARGENMLRVSGGGVGTTAISITNYPNFGPIFSAGQHRLDGWDECEAGRDTTGDCNIPPTYEFLYKSQNPMQQGLAKFDPADGLPADIATTTTENGETLPFIVRRESGFQDRDRYVIMALFKPEQGWSAWEPQSQWNRKLVITHGGNCGVGYSPGSPKLSDYSGTIPENPVLEQSYVTALGRGFAVLSTALDNNGHNCDVVLQAESLLMAKERLVEQYGELRFTIGTGCSGGAIVQTTVANAYPGIYQGLLTMCSYPDTLSAGAQFADLHLMRQYFEDPSKWGPGVVWSPHQYGLVEGHLTHVNAVAADEGLFKAATNPAGNCAGQDSYHPQNNPAGVRCSIIDWITHIFGRRPESVWSPMEQAAKAQDSSFEGFTALPIGTVGIQYGLRALQQGQITPQQFVDLNVNIGGLDIDIKPQAERTAAAQDAIERMFRSGMVMVGNNLNTVPIINFVGSDPGIAHDSVHAWWTRWRLDREHGHHDNHVMWSGPAPLIGDTQYVYQGLDAMNRWLEAIATADTDGPLPERIVANKPDNVGDQCSDGYGHAVQSTDCVDVLQQAYAYGTPRTIAGADKFASSFSCQLKEIDPADYAPLVLTDDQIAALGAVFPNGVCDYSQPSVGEDIDTVTWLTYRDGNDGIVLGGRQLPAAPDNSGGGLSAPAFSY